MFSVSFSFWSFLSSSSPLLFVVLRVTFLVHFSFVSVLSSCFPFDSCIAFFDFISLVADSVMLLFRIGATPPPPRSLRAKSMRISLASCLLSCVADVDLSLFHFFLLLFLPLFEFDSDTVCFSSCVLVGTMLSPRFRFLLRLV